MQDTAPLQQFVGGIEKLDLEDFSTMNFHNGEMLGFSIFDNALATFSGGRIDFISSFQQSDFTKHITMVVELDSIDLTGNLLTGNWLDSGDPFSITLLNQSGFDPVITNITFIPEPATLTLLALGGTLLRSRRVLRRRRFHRPQQSQFR